MNKTDIRRAALLGLPVSALCAFTTLPVAPTLAQDAAQTLSVITVEGARQSRPGETVLAPDALGQLPVVDGGEFLRDLPGISGVRMGGHAIDPVIRGQQGNRLNIVNDGIVVYGGCPNRMDPPSAFAIPETYDRIVVRQGYQTVTEGPGGPGGSVSFERDAPTFEPGKPYRAKVGGGINSNGNTRDAFADVAAGTDGFYLRAIGSRKEADNYDDGDGNEVRSAFGERGLDLLAGYGQEGGPTLEIGYTYDKITDALFAGAGMDSPLSENKAFHLKGEHPVFAGPLSLIRASAYTGTVDHRMDNYTLRTRTAPMAMRVDSESDTYGGSLSGDLQLGETVVTMGADLQNSRREALRYSGMSDMMVNRLSSILWPDTEIRQIGLFAEGKMPVTDATQLVIGARYDRVDAASHRANDIATTTGRSPNDLYRSYYGVTAEDRTENNVGGLVRLEHDLSGAVTLHAGVSRSVRTADATERAIASDQMASSWVGNPAIDPEQHHQAEIGLSVSQPRWSAGGSLYIDRVNDFILRDTARGQDGILLANGASVFRNVDALLTGFTVEGKYRLTDRWTLSGDVAYTHAENLDDSRAIAQIPPLEAGITLAYQGDGWGVGTKLRGALRQTRVDSNPATGSGLDTGETPGWATQDIFVTVSLLEPFEIKAGITNLFDRSYAYHLNKANAFDPTQVQVNEPGRSFFVRVTAEF